ncbi:Zinc-binding alcohol dehydrogenase domain-containing cipB protein [Rutstroemia sp. NJR-2017a WRK4]|nr:Zinc-binding alcohol dehydrogenase domain-containing cipB protein [Rutstroemia sp. NJR-2017a WRK4]
MANEPAPNLAAVIKTARATITPEVRPIPKPEADEIVVRNYAIAGNPADWKLQSAVSFITQYPTILGSDGCGIVHAVGSSVTKFKPGDRVTGFADVIISSKIDHGAWQTYTVLHEIATLKIPESMSFEEGSTFPMAYATAAFAFFVNLQLPRPTGPVEKSDKAMLIWGGASAVGSASIQLAKHLGYTVFATASPQHHQYLKSLGASALFDYRDPDAVSKIVEEAKSSGVKLDIGIDSIAENDTAKLSADILSATGGSSARLALAMPWPEKHPKPTDVQLFDVMAAVLFTKYADTGSWFFNDYLPNALEKGQFVPSPPVEIVDGGIEAAQEVFDRMKAGVSCKKLVVKVA